MNSALVTGLGAVALTGPRSVSPADEVEDGGDLVVERYPAQPLLARPQLAAGAELERKQLLLQGAARATEDHARSQAHDPDAGVARRFGGRLPVLHHVGEEAGTGSARLGQLLVAPVAVPADGRSRHEDTRRVARARRASRRAAPCRVRGCRGPRLYESVHRWSPSPAPARCTTASCPSSAGASIMASRMSHTTSPGRGRDRTRRVTSSPPLQRRGQLGPDEAVGPGDDDLEGLARFSVAQFSVSAPRMLAHDRESYGRRRAIPQTARPATSSSKTTVTAARTVGRRPATRALISTSNA